MLKSLSILILIILLASKFVNNLIALRLYIIYKYIICNISLYISRPPTKNTEKNSLRFFNRLKLLKQLLSCMLLQASPDISIFFSSLTTFKGYVKLFFIHLNVIVNIIFKCCHSFKVCNAVNQHSVWEFIESHTFKPFIVNSFKKG